MARGAKALAKPDAAARLADLVTLTACRAPGAKFQVSNPELQSRTRSYGHV
jgi:hypothetical protein